MPEPIGYSQWKKLIKKHKGLSIDGDATYDFESFYRENPQQSSSSSNSIWDSPLMTAVEQFSRRQESPYTVDSLSGTAPLGLANMFAGGGTKDDDDDELIQDRWRKEVPDATYVSPPVRQIKIPSPDISRDAAIRRAVVVYDNYADAKDNPMSGFDEWQHNTRRWIKDNISDYFPAGVSNCTLTTTQWIDPTNPIQKASSMVSNPSYYNYSPITAEEAIPGDIIITKNPNDGTYHTMLIEGFAKENGTYDFDGRSYRYNKGEPLLTYSRGGHDNSFLRKKIPLSVYTPNSDGKTENYYFRYNFPNEVFLPNITILPNLSK